MERVSKDGHEHRARCPSFETRPGVYPEVLEGAAPQDEVVRIDLKRKDYSSRVRAGVRRQMLIVSD
jgi:hypothetical protein